MERRDILFIKEGDNELRAVPIRISDETAVKISKLLREHIMAEQKELGHTTDTGIEMVRLAHILDPQ